MKNLRPSWQIARRCPRVVEPRLSTGRQGAQGGDVGNPTRVHRRLSSDNRPPTRSNEDVRTGTGSSQALQGYGTRGDTIYEDPASDWLAEPDGQVVQVSRYCTKDIWRYDSRLGDEHDDDGRLLNDTRAERASGSTLPAIADRLNAHSTTTPTGRTWSPGWVRKVTLQDAAHEEMVA